MHDVVRAMLETVERARTEVRMSDLLRYTYDPNIINPLANEVKTAVHEELRPIGFSSRVIRFGVMDVAFKDDDGWHSLSTWPFSPQRGGAYR